MDMLKNLGRRTLLLISGLCFGAVFVYEIYYRYLMVKGGGMAAIKEILGGGWQLATAGIMILAWLLLALGSIADKKGMYLTGSLAALAGSGIQVWRAIVDKGQLPDKMTETVTQLERAQASAQLVTTALLASAFLFLFFSLLVGHRKIALLTLLPVLLFAAADGAGYMIYSHFGQSYFTGFSGGKDWRVDAVAAAGLLLVSAATGISKAVKKAEDQDAGTPYSSAVDDEEAAPAKASSGGSVFAEPEGRSSLELASGEASDEPAPVPELELPKESVSVQKPDFDNDIPVLKIPEGLIDISVGDGGQDAPEGK